jgi:hypothetical protein
VGTSDSSGIVSRAANPAAPGSYWIRSDSSGEPQGLTDLTNINRASAISPDGKWLAGLQAAPAPSNGGAIWMAPIEGEPEHPRLGKDMHFLPRAIFPAFSPDGRWIAFHWQVPGKGSLGASVSGSGAVRGQWTARVYLPSGRGPGMSCSLFRAGG